MLRPRIIPCLLVHKSGLVKTTRFREPKYVGDPLNAVRIFNEKEVDELAVFDIDATAQARAPDYQLIRNLAAECRMPLCYGGGVCTPEQVEQIVRLGVEKVAIGSAAQGNPGLISEAARRVGRQSIVVVLDVRLTEAATQRYQVFTHNGGRATGLDPVTCAVRAEALGAGEIVVNSIDRDGTLAGYDMQLVDQVRDAVAVPLTVLGGAGSYDDLGRLINRHGTIGAAAGSIFVFKGKYRAVLIQYPSVPQRDAIHAGRPINENVPR